MPLFCFINLAFVFLRIFINFEYSYYKKMKQLSSIHYATISLIILSLLMYYVYFANTRNLNSPIIKYEFVKTSNDVKDIFMENNEFKKDIIQGVHDQNIIDYAYMLSYSLLLIFAFIKIKDFERKKIYIIGIIAAVIALATDAIENILLFNISELLTTRNNFATQVDLLFIVTRIKWFSIAIALFIMSFHYYKFKILGKIFSIVSSLPFIFSILYYFIDTEIIQKYFTGSIMIAFVILMIWIFIPKNSNKSISFYKEIAFK